MTLFAVTAAGPTAVLVLEMTNVLLFGRVVLLLYMKDCISKMDNLIV